MVEWLSNNYIEVIGAVLGLIYLFLEIKANVWLWPVGFLTSALYVAVFFSNKFYADMGLQLYYVVISVYGWIRWRRGTSSESATLPIVHLRMRLCAKLIVASALLFAAISFVLINFTDSPIPYWDSLTTSLSIVATWMLAKKIIEQWWVWVFVNFVSLCLYWWRGLYPSVVLFVFYTVMAVVGYYSWRKILAEQTKNEER